MRPTPKEQALLDQIEALQRRYREPCDAVEPNLKAMDNGEPPDHRYYVERAERIRKFALWQAKSGDYGWSVTRPPVKEPR